jgi:hypothetical protein
MKRLIGLAFAAPLVIFGLIYFFVVRPRQEAADTISARLSLLRAEVHNQGHTPEGRRTPDAVEAIATLVNRSAVGGVVNLSIEPAEGGGTSLPYTPITVAFDARYEQIATFFQNLRSIPLAVELSSIELTAAPANALVSARLVLFEFDQATRPNTVDSPVQIVDATRAPRVRRDPFHAASVLVSADLPRSKQSTAAFVRTAPPLPPENPTVQSILLAGHRRVALINDRIVRPGDRVGTAVVRSIDQDAVVLATETGELRRITLERPALSERRGRESNGRQIRTTK